jgi:hypothetical protein
MGSLLRGEGDFGYRRLVNSLRVQGVYYFAGGLWPLLHFSSFETVTGPKPDRFVTEAAGALYTAIGATLLLGRTPATATRRLALLASAATLIIDVRHRSSVRWVYLADAAVEALFATWVVADAAR